MKKEDIRYWIAFILGVLTGIGGTISYIQYK